MHFWEISMDTHSVGVLGRIIDRSLGGEGYEHITRIWIHRTYIIALQLYICEQNTFSCINRLKVARVYLPIEGKRSYPRFIS